MAKIYLTTVLDENDNEVELYYLTLKPFTDHTEEIQRFIENKINESTPILETFIDGGAVKRVHKQIYEIVDGLKIARVYTYQYPAEHPQNGIINNINTEYYGD